jgi:hypothetical protein
MGRKHDDSKPGSKGHRKAAKDPKFPKAMSPTHETIVAPVKFADDRNPVNQLIRTDSAVQKVEYARNTAYLQAHLGM